MPDWSPEELRQIFSVFTYQRVLLCPACSGPLSVERGEGATSGGRRVTFTCPACSRSKSEVFVRIGPEDFIRGPFERCPGCGKDEFGLLMVNGDSYRKRCRSCLESRAYELPPLDRKV